MALGVFRERPEGLVDWDRRLPCVGYVLLISQMRSRPGTGYCRGLRVVSSVYPNDIPRLIVSASRERPPELPRSDGIGATFQALYKYCVQLYRTVTSILLHHDMQEYLTGRL